MAELADALDLGSSGVIRAGSSPVTCTINAKMLEQIVFEFYYALKNTLKFSNITARMSRLWKFTIQDYK